MRSQIWVLSALCAVALSAPTLPLPSDLFSTTGGSELAEYFNLIASKIQEGKEMSSAPVCDLSNAHPPVASPTPLPTPSAGLFLKHVAIGRGTQNYTCGANSTAAPVSIGANATLYNASCIAASYPDVLASLPGMALSFNLTSPDQSKLSGPASLDITGHHYFTNTTTPFFNLSVLNLGMAQCSKNNTVNAPATAPIGQDGAGFGSVPWLKLKALPGATGGLTEIYRLNTAGGNPPLTCEGLEGQTFFVQYSAEYWFYASP